MECVDQFRGSNAASVGMAVEKNLVDDTKILYVEYRILGRMLNSVGVRSVLFGL